MSNNKTNINGTRTTLQCPECGASLEVTVASTTACDCNSIEGNLTGKYSRARQRFATLQEHGIDTSNYFCLTMPNGGEEILMSTGENGLPIAIDDDMFASLTQEEIQADPILREIYENGYIQNTLLHRRWVMAQMMRMINYKSWDGKRSGYNSYINDYFGYRYAFKQMLDEVHTMVKLFESCDKRAFEERKYFFTSTVVADTCRAYVKDLRRLMDSRKVRKHKRSYRTNNRYIELPSRTYVYLEDKRNIINELYDICDVMEGCKSYRRLEIVLTKFIKHPYVKPQWFKNKETLPSVWKNAYKAAGAYYTLMNMVKFHNCFITTYEDGVELRGMEAVGYLQERLFTYDWEGFRFFALLKRTIDDNDFTRDKFVENVLDSQKKREEKSKKEKTEALAS